MVASRVSWAPFLLVAVALFGFVSVAASTDDASWKTSYTKAEAFFQAGQFEQASSAAKKVWERAESEFGSDDVRTYGSEMLWLATQMYGAQARGGELDEELMRRMAFIQDKAVIRREIAFEMTWRYGDPAKEWPLSKHIILTFVDYPNHHVSIYSPDLDEYLESLETDRVRVVFEVTYEPTGDKMRGYHEVQIGELKGWRSEWGGGGTTGEYVPSPWKDGPGETGADSDE